MICMANLNTQRQDRSDAYTIKKSVIYGVGCKTVQHLGCIFISQWYTTKSQLVFSNCLSDFITKLGLYLSTYQLKLKMLHLRMLY